MTVSKSANFARAAHEGQFRRYGHADHPYIWHPMRVAGVVSMHEKATDVMIEAAWLHDTTEDCGVKLATIEAEFGEEVSQLVYWLTNPSKGSTAPRKERKAMDRAHLEKAPWEAKLIKLVDRLDNLKDVYEDPSVPYDFVKLYRKESVALLKEALTDVDHDLWVEAMSYAE